ncbi:MAG TPA: cation diffusion facilitator family transporter [Candidatus Nanopelagicaceae bacterium]|nr:cation diffusion facilitator family transporter [Candidatus Nanopelagicaceae bacterium]
MSGPSEGRTAVVVALAANLAIAVSKFLAFAFTGSSSMLAEGVHSVADSGNQILLIIGGKRSKRVATAEHPFGYGRDRYIYSFLVAIVLFSVGGLFAVFEGAQKLRHPHEITSPGWALATLAVALLLESISLRTAYALGRVAKAELSWAAYIRQAKAPELPVVLLEDFAALVGLIIAALAVGATIVFHAPVLDGVGTLLIGVLLISVAVVLAIESKSLLLGEAASSSDAIKIHNALLETDQVERVIHLRTLHLSPDEILVAAKIAIRHDSTALSIARAIDAAEVRIRSAVPKATLIYLEPDIDREG